MKKTTVNLNTGQTIVSNLTEAELAYRADYAANVRPLELQAALRRERNRLLAETDRFALADQTLSDEMRTYRQALRDLPSNTTDFDNVVWPNKPAEIS
jgi:hypothetical protein